MTRALPAALVLAAVLAAGAIWAAASAAPPRIAVEGPVWRYREGDLLYRFHATFREEKLFDAAADPYETRDLAAARPVELMALRAAFLKRLHRPDLEHIPVSGEAWRNDLAGNGYYHGPPR